VAQRLRERPRRVEQRRVEEEVALLTCCLAAWRGARGPRRGAALARGVAQLDQHMAAQVSKGRLKADKAATADSGDEGAVADGDAPGDAGPDSGEDEATPGAYPAPEAEAVRATDAAREALVALAPDDPNGARAIALARDDGACVWTALRLIGAGESLRTALAALDAAAEDHAPTLGDALADAVASPVLDAVARAEPDAWWASR
jgi:hypothetical protein